MERFAMGFGRRPKRFANELKRSPSGRGLGSALTGFGWRGATLFWKAFMVFFSSRVCLIVHLS
jgi:hypothetical protein